MMCVCVYSVSTTLFNRPHNVHTKHLFWARLEPTFNITYNSDSQRQLEQWQNGSQADPNLTIPLLMQNQAPQGFEDGDRVKVDLRPESVSLKS